MDNRKVSVLFFAVVILVIFSVTEFQSYRYKSQVSDLDIIEFAHSDFLNTESEGSDITNRSLEIGENYTQVYQSQFNIDLFYGRLSKAGDNMPYWYVYIDRPDCQYIEVYLNSQLIGAFGRENGRANLWNGRYIFRFNERLLLEENTLEIHQYSEYMTGVAGAIQILSEDEYREMSQLIRFNEKFSLMAEVVVYFIGFIVLLVCIAWRKRLYNVKGYIYFIISIIFLGLGLLDFRVEYSLELDYEWFKKLIVISHHCAITFATLAVGVMLNTNRKFNIGMIGTTVVILAAIMTNDLQEFRNMYIYLNVFIILCSLQLFITMIKYRKRTPISSDPILIGFGLCLIQVIRIVLVTSGFINRELLLELSLLAIFYALIVLFVVFLELLQMGEEVIEFDMNSQEYAITSHMQGYFTLDKKLKIVGRYSVSCNQIFEQFILGKSITEILDIPDEEMKFFCETVDAIFDPSYEYKEGFVALLINEITIRDRIYHIDYFIEDNNGIFLKVVLSDITMIKKLEKQKYQALRMSRFVANALQSKGELSYLIERVEELIDAIRHGRTDREILMELHTIKGNLGQFGFNTFEQKIHEIESLIDEEKSCDNDGSNIDYAEQLQRSFKHDLNFIYQYIDEEGINNGQKKVEVSVDYIDYLEKTYIENHKATKVNEYVMNAIKQLRFKSVQGLLKRYIEYVGSLANETEKSIFPLDIFGDNIYVEPIKGKEIMTVLAAVFRNAVVHGIEQPDVRIQQGKDSTGRIGCEVICNEFVHIRITDDGRGIDPKEVSKRALKKGIIQKVDWIEMTEEEKLNLIFMDKMSVQEEVDLYAGRGFGLAAVKHVVEKYGGSIQVESSIGKGTTIEIKIPLDSLSS